MSVHGYALLTSVQAMHSILINRLCEKKNLAPSRSHTAVQKVYDACLLNNISIIHFTILEEQQHDRLPTDWRRLSKYAMHDCD